MKVKNKSLLKNISLILLSVFIITLSIFNIILLSHKKDIFKVVKADTVNSNFYGSSFYVPVDIKSYQASNYYWNNKTWTGLTNFRGEYIWSDGLNYYYSYGGTQYVLDIQTSTWSQKTWTGLSSFDGNNIWTDGVNYYFSSGGSHYVLYVQTSTWSLITWTGLKNFNGYNIWTDGFHYYYSNSSNQFLWTPYYSWRDLGDTLSNDQNYTHVFASVSIRFLGNQDNTYNLYVSSVLFFPHNSNFSYSITNKLSSILSTDFNDYSDYIVYSVSQHTFDLYIPFYYQNYANVLCISYYMLHVTSTGGVAATDVNFSKVSFGSSIEDFTDPNTQGSHANDKLVTNTVMYSNSLNQNVAFTFDYVINSNTPIFYYADDIKVLNDILSFNEDGRQDEEFYFRFNTRTYFIGANTSSIDYSTGYNTGYNDGYAAGYNIGEGDSQAIGQYQYNFGYNSGYEAGVNAANNYSFLGLISAVIDAPISYFRSLFNFELLGVNLVGFITGLFTLAIIIVIVKKVV